MSLLKFKKEKCEALLFAWNNTMQRYSLRIDCQGSSSPELDLYILVDRKVNVPAARITTSIMGYVNRSTASVLREAIVLLSICETTSGMLFSFGQPCSRMKLINWSE